MKSRYHFESVDVTTLAPPDATCPHCGYGASHLSGDQAPVPGSIGMCISCMEVSLVGDDLRQRKPTLTEQLQIDADPTVRRVRELIRTAKQAVKL